MKSAAAAMTGSAPSRATRLPRDLDAILRGTSRSIYLTLKVAPRPMRRQLMLGYLFCRAADTIADTRVLPPERRVEMLKLFRAQFERGEPERADLKAIASCAEAAPSPGPGFSSSERALLRRLEECFGVYRDLEESDRTLLRKLLSTLTLGMQMDLDTFPPEESGALGIIAGDADLDRYCYHVAGCVGEFWTELQAAHIPALGGLDLKAMLERGARFGKGLQMTNVLRDIPGDLRRGRCYLPRPRLEAAGVDPAELRSASLSGACPPGLSRRARPIIDSLLDLTLDHYRAGWEYTLAIPKGVPRLRLACAWPLLIGLKTLALLRAGAADLLSGTSLKVPRPQVRRLLWSSAWRVFSGRALEAMYHKLESAAR